MVTESRESSCALREFDASFHADVFFIAEAKPHGVDFGMRWSGFFFQLVLGDDLERESLSETSSATRSLTLFRRAKSCIALMEVILA